MAIKKTSNSDSIANTFEWLITAFIMAFVFRAFVMEAFRIPTGSMAETLKGAHWQVACPQCGYQYEYNFTQEHNSRFEKGIANLPEAARCPSCGYYTDFGGRLAISNGDRILVFKSLYQFRDPRRWDVIVFKNPGNPRENYIKRLIALPGEMIEIIDGDIYINNEIARKPQKVQEELWMCVFDNDHLPIKPQQGLFNNQHWKMPFNNDSSGKWQIEDANNPFILKLSANDINIHTVYYDTEKSPSANDFRATCAYNRPITYRYLPECSDLKAEFYLNMPKANSIIGISLVKYKTTYTAKYDSGLQIATIEKQAQGGNLIKLAEEKVLFKNNSLIKFSNVDHILTFQVGNSKIQADLGKGADDLGARVFLETPKVAILGSGNLTLSHIKIFRDIHYIDSDSGNIVRANEGNPFTLGKDEFFAMGDNSPASFDSRMWPREGFANKGKEPYRAGIVPRDYLVGKAFFVYWPGGFRISPTSAIPIFRWPIIPNVGDMKFIFGGKAEY